MKDLLDELHKLDEEDFQISSDFSKKVMKKIKKEKRFTTIKYVASTLSVACIIGISIFFVNRSGIVSNIANKASEQTTNKDAIQQMDTVNSTLQSSEQIETYAKESIVEEKTTTEAETTSGILADDIQVEEARDQDSNEAPSAVAQNESDKTYSKQFTKEDYLKEIANILKENNYNISEEPEKIIVHDAELIKVFDLLGEYVDIIITVDGENVIIETN